MRVSLTRCRSIHPHREAHTRRCQRVGKLWYVQKGELDGNAIQQARTVAHLNVEQN